MLLSTKNVMHEDNRRVLMKRILFEILACLLVAIPLTAQEREENYVPETDPLVLAKLSH